MTNKKRDSVVRTGEEKQEEESEFRLWTCQYYTVDEGGTRSSPDHCRDSGVRCRLSFLPYPCLSLLLSFGPKSYLVHWSLVCTRRPPKSLTDQVIEGARFSSTNRVTGEVPFSTTLRFQPLSLRTSHRNDRESWLLSEVFLGRLSRRGTPTEHRNPTICDVLRCTGCPSTPDFRSVKGSGSERVGSVEKD